MPPPVIRYVKNGFDVHKLAYVSDEMHVYHVFDEDKSWVDTIEVVWGQSPIELQFILRDPKWTKDKLQALNDPVIWQDCSDLTREQKRQRAKEFSHDRRGYVAVAESDDVDSPKTGPPALKLSIKTEVQLLGEDKVGKWFARTKSVWLGGSPEFRARPLADNFQPTVESNSGTVTRITTADF